MPKVLGDLSMGLSIAVPQHQRDAAVSDIPSSTRMICSRSPAAASRLSRWLRSAMPLSLGDRLDIGGYHAAPCAGGCGQCSP